MMHFGGTLTLNGLVVYIATNFEKILLGRFWGVDAVGLYGRAYQLINIPTENLNSAAGEVAFSALSRLQHDPHRLKKYFLKGYSLVLALTLPITIACALFADDIILVLLGPKWKAAATILRLLAPTMLVFAIANPSGMATLFDRNGQTALQHGFGHRTYHDRGLCIGTTLWAKRRGVCLLTGDGDLADSSCPMGIAWYGRSSTGYPARAESTVGFEHRGWRYSLSECG